MSLPSIDEIVSLPEWKDTSPEERLKVKNTYRTLLYSELGKKDGFNYSMLDEVEDKAMPKFGVEEGILATIDRGGEAFNSTIKRWIPEGALTDVNGARAEMERRQKELDKASALAQENSKKYGRPVSQDETDYLKQLYAGVNEASDAFGAAQAKFESLADWEIKNRVQESDASSIFNALPDNDPDALKWFFSSPTRGAALVASTLSSAAPDLARMGVAGLAAGPAAAGALGGFAEYSGSLYERLQDASGGDPAIMASLLSNKEFVDDIKTKSAIKGTTIAVVDFATAKLGGLIGSKLGDLATTTARKAGVATGAAAGGAVMEGVGEIASQVAAGDPVSVKEGILEMAPGIAIGGVSAVAEMTSPEERMGEIAQKAAEGQAPSISDLQSQGAEIRRQVLGEDVPSPAAVQPTAPAAQQTAPAAQQTAPAAVQQTAPLDVQGAIDQTQVAMEPAEYERLRSLEESSNDAFEFKNKIRDELGASPSGVAVNDKFADYTAVKNTLNPRPVEQPAVIPDAVLRAVELKTGGKVQATTYTQKPAIVKTIEGVLGKRVVPYVISGDTQAEINGFVDRGDRNTIYVNSNLGTEGLIGRTLIHEAYHNLEDTPEAEAFRRAVLDANPEAFAAYKQKQLELDLGIPEAELANEFIADIAGERGMAGVLESVKNSVPRNVFKDFIDRLRRLVSRLFNNTDDPPTLKNLTEIDNALRALLQVDPNVMVPGTERPLSKANVQMSRMAQRDADYMRAVESGDVAEQQRLVDEAARAAGLTDKQYHSGSFSIDDGDTQFNDWSHFGTLVSAEERIGGKAIDDMVSEAVVYEEGGRFFLDEDDWYNAPEDGFATDEEARQWVGREAQDMELDTDATITPVFLDVRNPVRSADAGVGGNIWLADRTLRAIQDASPKALSVDDLTPYDALPFDASEQERRDALTSAIESKGYDGIIYRNAIEDAGKDSYLVFHPNQIKSADPVTYDDKGNVIPLSQRFNPASSDIRFSRSTKRDADYMRAVESDDVAEQQRLVDEAARAAGFDVEGFHGTSSPTGRRVFDVFQPTNDGVNSGFEERPATFFAVKKHFADMFAEHMANRKGEKATVIRAYLKIAAPVEKFSTSETVADLKSRGVTGTILRDVESGEVIEYAVFDPDQIKSADPITRDDQGNVIPLSQRFNLASPDIRFSRSEPFYSQLAKVVDQKMPKSASVEQIKGIITNPQTGIKAEELKWTGVIPWLDSKIGKVTKQEVLDYLKNEGAVQFEETVMGSGERPETEFGQYQLPGGENYREVVLTIPEVDTTKEASIELRRFMAEMTEKYPNETGTAPRWSDMTDAEADRMEYLEGEANAGKFSQTRKDREKVNYTSSHFPDTPNYVAHMRTNERTDITGEPGLFIEEIQSDRHQEGRKKGYKGDPLPDGWTASKEMVEDSGLDGPQELWVVRDAAGEKKGTASTYSFKTDEDAIKWVTGKGNDAVPDAPFRTTWPLAMFKRALRDAVASGKAWVGWTDGETQNERYDLSKQVSEIAYRPSNGNLRGYDLEEKNVLDVTVPPEKLEDYVGKDVAKRLLNSPLDGMGEHNLSGDDLKVEGPGMKAFYDNMLPKEIGKYVKQWGAKVEKAEVGTATSNTWEVLDDEGVSIAGPFLTKQEAEGELGKYGGVKVQMLGGSASIWKVPITPQMRKSISTVGQVRFSRGEKKPRSIQTQGDRNFIAEDIEDPAKLKRVQAIISPIFDWKKQSLDQDGIDGAIDFLHSLTSPAGVARIRNALAEAGLSRREINAGIGVARASYFAYASRLFKTPWKATDGRELIARGFHLANAIRQDFFEMNASELGAALAAHRSLAGGSIMGILSQEIQGRYEYVKKKYGQPALDVAQKVDAETATVEEQADVVDEVLIPEEVTRAEEAAWTAMESAVAALIALNERVRLSAARSPELQRFIDAVKNRTSLIEATEALQALMPKIQTAADTAKADTAVKTAKKATKQREKATGRSKTSNPIDILGKRLIGYVNSFDNEKTTETTARQQAFNDLITADIQSQSEFVQKYVELGGTDEVGADVFNASRKRARIFEERARARAQKFVDDIGKKFPRQSPAGDTAAKALREFINGKSDDLAGRMRDIGGFTESQINQALNSASRLRQERLDAKAQRLLEKEESRRARQEARLQASLDNFGNRQKLVGPRRDSINNAIRDYVKGDTGNFDARLAALGLNEAQIAQATEIATKEIDKRSQAKARADAEKQARIDKRINETIDKLGVTHRLIGPRKDSLSSAVRDFVNGVSDDLTARLTALGLNPLQIDSARAKAQALRDAKTERVADNLFTTKQKKDPSSRSVSQIIREDLIDTNKLTFDTHDQKIAAAKKILKEKTDLSDKEIDRIAENVVTKIEEKVVAAKMKVAEQFIGALAGTKKSKITPKLLEKAVRLGVLDPKNDFVTALAAIEGWNGLNHVDLAELAKLSAQIDASALDADGNPTEVNPYATRTGVTNAYKMMRIITKSTGLPPAAKDLVTAWISASLYSGTSSLGIGFVSGAFSIMESLAIETFTNPSAAFAGYRATADALKRSILEFRQSMSSDTVFASQLNFGADTKVEGVRLDALTKQIQVNLGIIEAEAAKGMSANGRKIANGLLRLQRLFQKILAAADAMATKFYAVQQAAIINHKEAAKYGISAAKMDVLHADAANKADSIRMHLRDTVGLTGSLLEIEVRDKIDGLYHKTLMAENADFDPRRATQDAINEIQANIGTGETSSSLVGGLTEGFSYVSRKIPGVGPAVLGPIRTVGNVIDESAWRAPILGIARYHYYTRGGRKLSDTFPGIQADWQVKRRKVMAYASTGGGILLYALMYAAQGDGEDEPLIEFSGGFPLLDPDERQRWEEKGIEENVLYIGKVGIPVTRGVMQSLYFPALFAQQAVDLTKGDANKMQTFLAVSESLIPAIQLVKSKAKDFSEYNAENYLMNGISNFAPAAGFIRTTTRPLKEAPNRELTDSTIFEVNPLWINSDADGFVVYRNVLGERIVNNDRPQQWIRAAGIPAYFKADDGRERDERKRTIMADFRKNGYTGGAVSKDKKNKLLAIAAQNGVDNPRLIEEYQTRRADKFTEIYTTTRGNLVTLSEDNFKKAVEKIWNAADTVVASEMNLIPRE